MSDPSQTLILQSPVEGIVVPLSEVPDPVFAGLSLGEGIAIDPLGGCLHAPCDGEIVQCARTRHALTLRTDAGVELLLHLGLDTVELEGQGIELMVSVGDSVRAGDPLCRFDADVLALGASALITPLVVTEPAAWHLLPPRHSKGERVALGEELLVLTRTSAEQDEAATTKGPLMERCLTLALAAGLHARPAARLRAIAREYGVNLEVHLEPATEGAGANVESLSALMNLGLVAGSALRLRAQGTRGEAALDAAEALLTTPEAKEHAAGTTQAVPTQAFEKELETGELAGLIASQGLATGPLIVCRPPLPSVPYDGEGESVESPRLKQALNRISDDLAKAEVQATHQGQPAEAEIFAAHGAWLEDPNLAAEAEARISDGRSAGQAWREALDAEAERLAASGNDLLAARVADLRDLQRRVMVALSGDNQEAAPELPEGAILVAEDLTPSELVAVADQHPAGLCLSGGGTTSHVAILARARGIPCLVAMGQALLEAAHEAALGSVILDAEKGCLALKPTPMQLAEMAERIEARRQQAETARAAAHEPAITLDGRTVEVRANIGGAEEACLAAASGADGVGLLRSEFLFLGRDSAPDEATQREEYQAALTALDGKPVIIRTLDIGADKQLPYLRLPTVPNPALGVRGVRLWQSQPELLETQLRAILGVTPLKALHIMLPMVSEAAELREVRQRLETLAAELGLSERPRLGAMIEVPSAALCAASLADEADFLSIGTNDLTQYTLAMDREDPALASRADVLHPAVLRLIQATVAGAAKRCPVGVCGSAASDELAAPLLVALGVDELSVEPARIPAVKAALRHLDTAALAANIPELLALPDAVSVRLRLGELLALDNEASPITTPFARC
ncbi:phosphoenolpyruvate--protein phosphotransferase [Halomonas sp. CUBES01]|uniref:phosphoenolpyruvate--protein phosphotransferase n=1 Tax=Vreelandella gomseomensis TaxID=370766 RepID=A0ABU1GDZ0_9GAMM|nr:MULTISPECIES: phosphoenolpyruvate--protein phosphotransferase [Halomonas]MDR5875691.1 phosphoenolpyruvate--protein phosphotransferase [Halomonas gomseomensis]MEC4767892.1 phosphoenolpyruvate--protein phosphotransferase [Halomonas sp. CUBES01]